MGNNKDFKSFVETLDSPNTRKIAMLYQDIGKKDYTNCTPVDLEQTILKLKPSSPRDIQTICYIMGAYAKYLGDDRFYDIVYNLNKDVIWLKAKPEGKQKFISHEKFVEAYNKIGESEYLNALYYKTLFRSVYEGIYNDDLSVLKNLRASDVKGNIVTLRNDNGDIYDLKISNELAEDLIKLGDIDEWEMQNKYRVYVRKMTGLYPDSCFKCLVKDESSKYSFRFTYYRFLRKIAKEYLQYNLLPLQLYISGIMYRIRLEIEKYQDKYNITLESTFSNDYKGGLPAEIISDELKRSNYNIGVGGFKNIVKGHIDVFEK